ncbi:MAG: metallophosphoesterase, partial [Pseudomonadota bacterium]
MRKSQAKYTLAVGIVALALACSCALRPEAVEIDGQDVRAVFLHTSDIHSRLIPYDMDVGEVDKSLGLLQANAPFGGIARLSALARQMRRDNERFAHVDTGDVFQGAPIFNSFSGEPEFKALTNLGLDVFAIGNHEFDNGATQFVEKARTFAHFPMLAANYVVEDPNVLGGAATGEIAQPYTILNLKGLRVGVIGMGSIMHSTIAGGSSIGLRSLRSVEILQSYIDFLRPQVDLVVTVGHLGYHDDLRVIPRVEGLDIAFGGHLHIVLYPPSTIQDCDISRLRRETDQYRCDTPEKLRQAERACESKEACDDKPMPQEIADCQAACQKEAQENCVRKEADFRYKERLEELDRDIANLEKRGCHPRNVLLVHSGAFLKYAGVLEVVARQCTRLDEKEVCAEHDSAGVCTKKVARRCVGRSGGDNDWEIINHDYTLVPIDKNLPEDPKMLQVMEPYVFDLNRQQILTQFLGYTPSRLRRFSAGSGDSQLGNLVAGAMQTRNQVWADFSITNSLGIRSDMVIGPV